MGAPMRVYVALLDEGTAVWRPVAAVPAGGGVFRLAGPVPDGERWAFQPGELVRCESRVFADGEQALTAVAAADAEPGRAAHGGGM